jgi:hypothetical protein
MRWREEKLMFWPVPHGYRDDCTANEAVSVTKPSPVNWQTCNERFGQM